MDSLVADLSALGLSEKSARVYLTLLQLGSGTVHDIASRAGIVRTTCYPILEELERRGLVTTTRAGKKTIFLAEAPESLIRNAQTAELTARKLVPALAHIFDGNEKRPKIKVYEGLSGVWHVYNQVIVGEGHEIRSFVPADTAIRIAGEKKVRAYIRARVGKKIRMRAIMQRSPLIEKEYAKYDTYELRESRFIDPKKFPVPVEITLYPPHHIAIASFPENLGMIIESKPIYTALGSLFELVWLSGTK